MLSTDLIRLTHKVRDHKVFSLKNKRDIREKFTEMSILLCY